MIISLYSDGKGGVGKSVIAQMLTFLLSLFLGEDNVALFDMSRDASVTARLLKNPEPPFVSDWLMDRCELPDVLRTYQTRVGEKEYRFWIGPNNNQPVSIRDVSGKVRELAEIAKYLKAIILDLPTFPYDSSPFTSFLQACDVVVLVSTPDRGSLKAVLNTRLDDKFIVPVLNMYHPVLEQYKIMLEQRYGRCITLPHDKALLNLKPERTRYAVKSLSKDFNRQLGKLAKVIVTRSFAHLR